MLKIKNFTIFFAIFLLFSTFAPRLTGYAAFNPGFEVYSEGVYMVNIDRDTVIMSKNADEKLYPASTAKIMTCLVALENIKDFGAKVECPYECFNEFYGDNPNYYGASTAAIEPLQSNVTYNDCLYGLMLASGCEAANILAYNISGDIDAFVKLMNDTAKKIGCKNTHFTNPHGLFDDDNYTTAYDLYLITRYAIDNYPGFMRICNTYEYEMPANSENPYGYSVIHTNLMMRNTSDLYYEGVSGIKTGSIPSINVKVDGEWDWDNELPGFCSLVTSAERNGETYLLVTLQAPYKNEEGETVTHYSDHIKLYDWAFNEFEYAQIIEKNEQVMKVDVEKGLEADAVGVVTTEDYFMLLPKSIDKSSIQRINPVVTPFTAPVEKGLSVGELELKLNGETIATIPLVTEYGVELDVIEEYKEKLVNILTSPQFIASVIVFAVLIIAFITAMTISKRRKLKAAELQRRRKIQMAPRGNNNGKGNIRRR